MAPSTGFAGVATAVPDDVGRSWCPHIAILLGSAKELHPALAAFYALGASRNAWLFHRSLPGQGAIDRAGLERAGLDVATFEAEGRFCLSELPVTDPPERWAQPWLPVVEQRLRDGFDAVWWSRFPVDAAAPQLASALEYDRAWDAAMRGQRAVSLCVYIIGPLGDEADVAERLATMHDGLLRTTGPGIVLQQTRER